MARSSRYGGYPSDSEDSEFKTAYSSPRSSQPTSAPRLLAPPSHSTDPSRSSHRTGSSHPSHGSAQSHSSHQSSQHTNQESRRGRLQLFEERAGTVGRIATTAGGIATATGLAYTVYHTYKKKKEKRAHSKKSNDEKRNHQASKNTYERQNSEVDLRLKEKGGHQKLWYERQISEVDLLVKERGLTPDERWRLARRNEVEEPWHPRRDEGRSQMYSRYSAEEGSMHQSEGQSIRGDHYGESGLRRSEHHPNRSPERLSLTYYKGEGERPGISRRMGNSRGNSRSGVRHYFEEPVTRRSSSETPIRYEDTGHRRDPYPERQPELQSTHWDRTPRRAHSRGRGHLSDSDNTESYSYSRRTFSGNRSRPIQSYRYRRRSSSRSRYRRREVQSDSESVSSIDERSRRLRGLLGLSRKLLLKSLKGSLGRDGSESEFEDGRGARRRKGERRYGSRSRCNSYGW